MIEEEANLFVTDADTEIDANTPMLKDNSDWRHRKHNTRPKTSLNKYYDADIHVLEIGVDEAGRGPLFGRVYASAVVLPKTRDFDHSMIKDSKRFHSKNSIERVAAYIKEHAIAWSVAYEDERTIDRINILQATQSAMHKCILDVVTQLSAFKNSVSSTSPTQPTPTNMDAAIDTSTMLLIDGTYFKPLCVSNPKTSTCEYIPYVLIAQGDNKYASIAAASILAKVERDAYIESMCVEHPDLNEKYSISNNKGYGTKDHMVGLRKHGISIWHRRTFKPCNRVSG